MAKAAKANTTTRRNMLALAGGLAAATAASTSVAVNAARSEGQSEIERLVREWWALEDRYVAVRKASEDEWTAAHDEIEMGQEAILDRIKELPVRTIADFAAVASIVINGWLAAPEYVPDMDAGRLWRTISA